MRRDYIDKNKLRCYRLHVRDNVKKQLIRILTRNKLFFLHNIPTSYTSIYCIRLFTNDYRYE